MAAYRWNVSAFAEGYDAAASVIHPHYEEMQKEILHLVGVPPLGGKQGAPAEAGTPTGLIVDLGGGSGRLAEKILARFPQVQVVVVDQSEPFLAIAERRMARFGDRGRCTKARLQENWESSLPMAPVALLSMSAIHHLEPAEKQSLYRRCYNVLAPGGVLLNGDEVRPADDAEYLGLLQQWARHMERIIAKRQVPESMDDILRGWIARNVDRFGEPRKSGDDCHETIAVQLDYLRQSGFTSADCPWQRELWGVLRGRKAG